MSRAKRTSPAAAPAKAPRAWPAWTIPLALLALVLLQYHDALRLPFLFDDFTILQKVRAHSLAELWQPRELLYGWYRPWSREMHFWLLSHVAGLRPFFYHVANLALVLAGLLAFHALARRLAGAPAAAIAAGGLAVFGGWSGAILWAAGAQESWMVLLALGALAAHVARRPIVASALLALALLSKETALVVPVIALAACLVERERPAAIVRRIAPLALVTALWAALHPTLLRHASPAGGAAPSLANAGRTLLSLANLERVPAPDPGWTGALLAALPVVLVLVALAVIAARSRASDGERAPLPVARVALLGLAWFVFAAIPSSMAASWAAYYGVLAACGAWLALGVWLAPRVRVAVLALAVCALLQAASARTPAFEWGAPSYQRRAAALTAGLEHSLRAAHPTLPPHTRLYLEYVPQGFGAGEKWFEPVAEIGYGDTTLTVERLAQYGARPAGAPAGPDLFFGFAPPDRWIEFVRGPEDVAAALSRNPGWAEDHRRLALTLGRAGDWRGAAGELEKLARAFPAEPEYAANLAVCLRRAGDEAGAAVWARRADSLSAGGTTAR